MERIAQEAAAAPLKAVAYMRTSSATNVGADKDSEKRQRAAIEAYDISHQRLLRILLGPPRPAGGEHYSILAELGYGRAEACRMRVVASGPKSLRAPPFTKVVMN